MRRLLRTLASVPCMALGALSAQEALGQSLTVRDIAGQVGLGFSTRSFGEPAAADLNGDGKPEIILVAHGVSATSDGVWWNRNGTFVRGFRFPKKDRHGCAAADFGSPGGGRPDGRPDIYCTIGASKGHCNRCPNELWLQRSDGTFVNEARTWRVDDPSGRGREPTVLDADRNGLADLVVANEEKVEYPSPNRLFLNRGGVFEVVGTTLWRREVGSSCSAAGTLFSTHPDALFCTGSGVYTYKNNAGTFSDATGSTAYRGVPALDIEVADTSNDGRPEVILVSGRQLSVWSGNTRRFSYALNVNQGKGAGRDAVVCDVNGDGYRDIYVVQRFNGMFPDLLFLNTRSGSFQKFPDNRLPRVRASDGDAGTCVPWDNGNAILVTNGIDVAGPLQFLTFAD